MAQHGVTFDHAFSNAPVCSVARTTLITGCYAPRIGTQYHRRSAMAPMPPGIRMFPASLRDAGYYTTNNAKEDYNAIKGKDTISCPFSYAAHLTEIMLLGVASLRANTKLHYDAANMRVTNNDAANEFLTRTYRAGYSL